MFFSVRELDLAPISFNESIAPGVIEWIPGTTQVSPLVTQGQASLNEMTQEIRVAGHLAVSLQIECDRCLQNMESPVDTDFELVYEPLPEAVPGQELELHAEDIELGFYEGDGLELNDVLREKVLLELPTQALCSPDCKGLCPICGINRNEAACDCTTTIPDERWNALRNL